MVRIEVTVVPLTADEVRRSVCLATDPTDSIGRRIYDNLDAKISEVPYTTKDILTYPLNAGPVTFTVGDGVTAWAWGAWKEVVPAGAITADFVILGAIHGAASTESLHFMVQLGVGAAGAESPIMTYGGKFRYYSASGWYWEAVPVMFPIPRKVGANSRVAVRGARAAAATKTHNVKVIYYEL